MKINVWFSLFLSCMYTSHLAYTVFVVHLNKHIYTYSDYQDMKICSFHPLTIFEVDLLLLTVVL